MHEVGTTWRSSLALLYQADGCLSIYPHSESSFLCAVLMGKKFPLNWAGRLIPPFLQNFCGGPGLTGTQVFV